MDFLLDLLRIKNFNVNSEEVFETESKTSIETLSKMINVPESTLDRLFSLFFLTNPDKVIANF